MIRRRGTSLALTLPWTLTLLGVWLFPLAYAFVMGFTDYNLLRGDNYSWVGWDNYRTLFGDADFIRSLKNTLIFVIGTIPATTIISLAMALMLNKKFKGRGLFRAGYFLPSITSMVVIALIFTNLLQRGGYIAQLATLAGFSPPEYGFLYNKGTALYSIMAMDVWMSVGYYMLIFLAGLKAIPDELYEAAEIHGATPPIVVRSRHRNDWEILDERGQSHRLGRLGPHRTCGCRLSGTGAATAPARAFRTLRHNCRGHQFSSSGAYWRSA